MATIRRAGWAVGLLTALALALALAAGCGGGSATGDVTGTVTVDGKAPPPGSSITVFPMDGKSPTAGGAIVDGKYSVRGVPVGLAKIEIRAPRPINRSKEAKAGPGAEGDWIEESLPAKYHDQSELRLDVKPGKNAKDFVLTSK